MNVPGSDCPGPLIAFSNGIRVNPDESTAPFESQSDSYDVFNLLYVEGAPVSGFSRYGGT